MNGAICPQTTCSHERQDCCSTPFANSLRKGGLYGLGEAYLRGEIEHEALESSFTYAFDNPTLLPGKFHIPTFLYLVRSLFTNPQRGPGIVTVADRHYNLGNLLFKAMLDSSMSYTCGVWKGASSLEDAQRNKLALICQKLNLRPGMKVLDIGCGWGNFAHFAATEYGATVVGLTISKEQAAFAQNRCSDLPVTILLEDYQTDHGEFDAVVSIEMIEAVGKKNIPEYFRIVEKSLKPGGSFLLQAISTETFNRRSQPSVDQFVLWLLRYIFPNGYVPNKQELVQHSARSLTLKSMESLCGDYEKTLRAWLHNFEQNWASLRDTYDDNFYRVWRFYLAGCAAFFERELVHVYQLHYKKITTKINCTL